MEWLTKLKNSYKYKAFISYSHRDERWASWLHRALESYRVPRKLIGSRAGEGQIPARIRPVFRDRDDLSSAVDLNTTVKQALTDSENMILICSPAAVDSHWVNEEVRQFAALGRENRIFCIIVDGEPAGVETSSTCFPAALAEVGIQEPLAADVRKWADGKHLSKLKLISGILGLPLDQLRRRDLQKRQKKWAMTAVAVALVAVILITAITARISTQQRRDSGESLVTYKLSELRTLLNVTEDPEDLAKLQQWDQQSLDRLIGNAGKEDKSLNQSAMDLRNQGNELYSSGALLDALKSYRDSWALLAENYRRDRSDQAVFFELGQAEFYIGQVYISLGQIAEAEEAFMAYAEITRRLITLQPENAEWALEMAFALNNLGSLQERHEVSNPERTLQFMQSALEYNQISLVLDPKNDYYRSELGQSQAFLADAQRGVCDLEGALQSRLKGVELEQAILAEDLDNVKKIQRLAFALSGYSNVQLMVGQTVEAMSNVRRSLKLLEGVLSNSPDDQHTKRRILGRQNTIASMSAAQGNNTQALAAFEALAPQWQELLHASGNEDYLVMQKFVFYRLTRDSFAMKTGGPEAAGDSAKETLSVVAQLFRQHPKSRENGNMLTLAVFQFWQTNHELPSEDILSMLPQYDSDNGRTRKCLDANMAVRKAIMIGDNEKARKLTTYLLNAGYREPNFLQLCQSNLICDEKAL